jgi:hypothetical protein
VGARTTAGAARCAVRRTSPVTNGVLMFIATLKECVFAGDTGIMECVQCHLSSGIIDRLCSKGATHLPRIDKRLVELRLHFAEDPVEGLAMILLQDPASSEGCLEMHAEVEWRSLGLHSES